LSEEGSSAALPRRRVLLPAALSLALLVSAAVLPRIVAGDHTGLAAGATAALTFVVAMIAAFVAAAISAIATFRHRRVLSGRVLAFGILPMPLLAAILVVVATIVHNEGRGGDPPPLSGAPARQSTAP
jgi:hypothetical protein